MKQDGKPSSSLNVAALFKDRTRLRVSEVATILRCSETHVVNLVKEFYAGGGKSGIEGFDTSNGQNTPAFAGGKKTQSTAIHIPVATLQKFIEARTACGKRRKPKRK